MNKLLPLTTAMVLALGLPQAVAAQDHGKGGDHGERGQDRGHENRGGGDDRGERGQDRAERVEPRLPMARGPEGRGRDDDNRQLRVERRDERDDSRLARDVERRLERRADGRDDDDRPVVVLRREHGLIDGCPPGLARKDNGCLPPGQARQLARTRFDSLWRSAADDRFDYRYDNGYLYRLNNQGSLLGYLPVLGGVLSPGNPWPARYDYQPVPTYLSQYYGLNDPYDYRYADGAVFGLDPKTQTISQVVALLTGQQINVGQRLPAGYDVYNLPAAYRDQYVDSAQSLYRYNDGYVYQVDPTTRLVQSVIQLIT